MMVMGTATAPRVMAETIHGERGFLGGEEGEGQPTKRQEEEGQVFGARGEFLLPV